MQQKREGSWRWPSICPLQACQVKHMLHQAAIGTCHKQVGSTKFNTQPCLPEALREHDQLRVGELPGTGPSGEASSGTSELARLGRELLGFLVCPSALLPNSRLARASCRKV